MRSPPGAHVAVVVKGYPRLSETFIAQELLELERRGLKLAVWSLRQPTDKAAHPMHRQISAPVTYLPEYLHRAPLRVLRGAAWSARRPGFGTLLRTFLADLRRDLTVNRVRRLGQAFVLARELPETALHVHVHYLHTPASVVRYAALLRGFSWSFSAHAKDIWTTPDWEKRDKIAACAFGVTCTAAGHRVLAALAPQPERVALAYHGLDLTRFPAPPVARPPRTGADPADPVRLVSVGRAVAKKGFADLLRALAALPPDLNWQFAHVGGGELLDDLKAQAAELGIASRVVFLGARAQPDVISLLREADIFVLPAKRARSGDQDGLPNVLMEAASQGLAIVATAFAGIPEFVRDGEDGVLVPPGDWEALTNAVNLLAREPERREALGRSAFGRLQSRFGMGEGIDIIEAKLRAALGQAAAATVPALPRTADAAP